ncbi:myosin phosphatase Rho-interacting protein-like [Cheilinus undulatus]|uniref:myosin phosphatase Rho-interacting protein-like n=1 Tax=Cheilinus undulatus TaxID=241271 RepID=UPI001BD3CE59|nr:myosin phosphatase Rho-interacting protein-like [Cheilinus undulatus]
MSGQMQESQIVLATLNLFFSCADSQRYRWKEKFVCCHVQSGCCLNILQEVQREAQSLLLLCREELQSIQRELEVLSEQYSQKCLENAHLAQALEAEQQALRQCQRENQELNAHNQELNNRLTAEITRMRSCFSGETALSTLTQGKDVYELEVLLRIKESEIQYLKEEIHSLKDELQSALRSLKEGLTVQERMKLFEAKDSKKI